MAACPKGRGIPWHRVVGAGGRILLREPRAALQRRLLESEGIEFRGARMELEGREWFPPKPRKRRRSRHHVEHSVEQQVEHAVLKRSRSARLSSAIRPPARNVL